MATSREGGPLFRGRVFQTVFAIVGVVETAHGLGILLDELTSRLSAKVRCVFFVSFAVSHGSISPTF